MTTCYHTSKEDSEAKLKKLLHTQIKSVRGRVRKLPTGTEELEV